MKSMIKVAVLTAMTGSISAATYTAGNNTLGFDANGVTDNAGNLLSGIGGSAAIGFFSSDAAVTSATSAADLLDGDWNAFGSSEANFVTPSIPTNFNGLFEAQGSEVANLANFTGENIYVVLGKGASLATSTEFIVYKFNTLFGDAADEPINVGLTLDADTISLPNLLVGSIGSAQTVSSLDSVAQVTFRMEALPVPEPSSTALLGLGCLGLIIRRRR